MREKRKELASIQEGLSSIVSPKKCQKKNGGTCCGKSSDPAHVCACRGDGFREREPLRFSPSEHDAFCALWESVVWGVSPNCHGRIPRPDMIVEKFFRNTLDAEVFLNRLTDKPFKLITFAFTHVTDRHTGETYETASEKEWIDVARRIRVKRELAHPPTPEESLLAQLRERQRKLQILEEDRTQIELAVTSYKERLLNNKKAIDEERSIIERTECILSELKEMARNSKSSTVKG